MSAVVIDDPDVLQDAEILFEILRLLDPNVATTGSPAYHMLRQTMEAIGWDQNRFHVAIRQLKVSGRLFLSCSRKTISFKPIQSVLRNPVNRKTQRSKRQTCVYCGITTKRITRDHVIPKSKGGRGMHSNTVWACQACNLSKGSRTPEEWAADILAYSTRS